MRTRHSSRGFTIVELLIVIVVIAILASISVVAFNGVQQRGKNAQMVSAARAYVNGLTAYGVQNGSYPTSFTDFAICVGREYPDDHCWDGPNGNYYGSDTFDGLVREYVSPEPTVPAKYYQITANDRRSGIVYYRNNPAGRQSIEYALDGANQQCMLSGATGSTVANNTTTRCSVTLPLPN